ncbi:MAG: hypothetical protein V2B18_08270 [Pseudomonadota bacterium]
MTDRRWNARRTSPVFGNATRFIRLTLVLLAVSCLGCVIGSQGLLKEGEPSTQPPVSDGKGDAPPSGLIKPVIQPETEEKAGGEPIPVAPPSDAPANKEPAPGPKATASASPAAADGPARPVASGQVTPQPHEPPIPGPERPSSPQTSGQAKEVPPVVKPSAPSPKQPVEKADQGRSSPPAEDQEIKRLAMAMAKDMPGIVKLKICYAIDYDEWWAVFYEDTGTLIDLKQYVWNKIQRAFEPHLVVKQVPRDRLEAHAAEREPGKACTSFSAPFPVP